MSRFWATAGDPRITCIACHNPHQPLVHSTAAYDIKCLACHRALTETDFRREVAAIKLPTLILQGDKDASCQIDFTGRRTAQLIKGSQFKVYPGAPHGLIITHAEKFNSDLAQFAAM